MQIHGYPYDDHGSTFIVEMTSAVWEKAGFAELADRPWAPGESDERSIERIQELFADVLGGHEVMANNSRWISFTTVRNEHWVHAEDGKGSVVILGDAAHTAHFSIGSGTKLAMEDALALAACLHEEESLATALATYETERKAVVLSTQRAAQASLEWFENLDQYVHQDPIQFGFNIMTRSRRVTYENLRLRDPEFVARCDAWYADHVGAGDVRPPMFQPARIGELDLVNRVVVSPMDMYVAVDGLISDFHLVHLGGKALGGAGLVMTEMVCVSPEGRITPGCAGLWDDEQQAAWRRVTDFVHTTTSARIGLQLGHSGAKGSTKLMWEGIDQPLEEDNWEVVAPSPVAYRDGVNQVPRELTRGEMDAIRDEFVESARRGAEAGFDLLELHCAHGYLLSGFLSPVTNHRTDEYGGDVDGRLRFPIEVFTAMREVWPVERPMTVRISATDWVDDGQSLADALAVARAFADAGADAIDVSTGQVTARERPAFGRSYQTPYADAIRNRLGVPTIAVGVISSYDDVNSILLAGRADLCALGRSHLYDPSWTLHAAVEQDYDGPGAVWPLPWLAGRRKPQTGRSDGPRPRLELIREGGSGTRHRRWRPGADHWLATRLAGMGEFERRDPSRLRISDADRHKVAELLRDAAGEGRIDLEELDERLEATYAAKTYADLVPITIDLPAHPGEQTPVPVRETLPATAGTFDTSFAIMGGVSRKGAWLVPPRHTAFTLMGGVDLDLREATFAARETVDLRQRGHGRDRHLCRRPHPRDRRGRRDHGRLRAGPRQGAGRDHRGLTRRAGEGDRVDGGRDRHPQGSARPARAASCSAGTEGRSRGRGSAGVVLLAADVLGRLHRVRVRDPAGVLGVEREVLARGGVEEVHLRGVDPDLGLVALLDPARAVEGDDQLGAHRLAVEVLLELRELVLHLRRRLEGDVGERLVAQPLARRRPWSGTSSPDCGAHVDDRGVLEVLGPDAGDQQPLAARPLGPLGGDLDGADGQLDAGARRARPAGSSSAVSR